jgi:hypothetical protein
MSFDKACRKETGQGEEITPKHRLEVHNWLIQQSNSNIWIKKGLTSASCFRQDKQQISIKVYDWIPRDSPYWNGI